MKKLPQKFKIKEPVKWEELKNWKLRLTVAASLMDQRNVKATAYVVNKADWIDIAKEVFDYRELMGFQPTLSWVGVPIIASPLGTPGRLLFLTD